MVLASDVRGFCQRSPGFLPVISGGAALSSWSMGAALRWDAQDEFFGATEMEMRIADFEVMGFCTDYGLGEAQRFNRRHRKELVSGESNDPAV